MYICMCIHICIHIYIYIYIYTYTHIHTYIHTYIHTCMHTYIHTHIHTYLPTYLPTYIHIYIYVCIHICMYVCIYIYTYIYIYIYIHLALLGWQNAFYEMLLVFGPQLLLDMWLPRSIGCSRGCGMSSCNHACESLLAWICWCGFVRRGLFRRGILLGADFLVWIS